MVITRQCFITDDIEWFEDRSKWEKLTSIGYKEKIITDKRTNNLHWTLDVVVKEDSLDSKEKKVVHNLGLIRRFVMFIIKLMKTYHGRSKFRVYLLTILIFFKYLVKEFDKMMEQVDNKEKEITSYKVYISALTKELEKQ